MLDLAQQYGVGPIALNEIARRQNIPGPYLEQLMAGLRKAGFVTSVRGARGGYYLTWPPEQIHVGAVLRVLEGTLEIEFDNGEPLGGGADCLPRHGTRLLWKQLGRRIASFVDGLTLADLLDKAADAQRAEGAYVYHI